MALINKPSKIDSVRFDNLFRVIYNMIIFITRCQSAILQFMYGVYLCILSCLLSIIEDVKGLAFLYISQVFQLSKYKISIYVFLCWSTIHHSHIAYMLACIHTCSRHCKDPCLTLSVPDMSIYAYM